MTFTNQTCTEDTIEKYCHTAYRLIRRFEFETEISFMDTDVFIDWLISNKKYWAPSTWRQYKAAITHYSAKYISDLDELNARICNTDNKGCKEEPRRMPVPDRLTSAQKAKSIAITDLGKIVHYLAYDIPSYWQEHGIEMFIAIYYTGLRPCEFEHANLKFEPDLGQYKLSVKNAKHTNGRGHGEFRTIWLSTETTALGIIDNVIARSKSPLNASGRPVSHNKYRQQCQRGLAQVIKKLFRRRKRKICLYSARHQFAANLKRAGYKPKEIAALMGHASDRTNTIHYAKSNTGNSLPCLPEAEITDVAKIRSALKPNPYHSSNEINYSPSRPSHMAMR
jgi:integrase